MKQRGRGVVFVVSSPRPTRLEAQTHRLASYVNTHSLLGTQKLKKFVFCFFRLLPLTETKNCALSRHHHHHHLGCGGGGSRRRLVQFVRVSRDENAALLLQEANRRRRQREKKVLRRDYYFYVRCYARKSSSISTSRSLSLSRAAAGGRKVSLFGSFLVLVRLREERAGCFLTRAREI